MVRLEGLGEREKSKDLFGNRTRDLLACSTMPQPATLPRLYTWKSPRSSVSRTCLLITLTAVNLRSKARQLLCSWYVFNALCPTCFSLRGINISSTFIWDPLLISLLLSQRVKRSHVPWSAAVPSVRSGQTQSTSITLTQCSGSDRERIISTERTPLVGEVSANFCV
jgi:hypothetical protein